MVRSDLSVEDALSSIVSSVDVVGSELLFLSESFGRVLYEDIYAGLSSPAFSVSAMDGYAVRSADILGGLRELVVIGESSAGGGKCDLALGEGESVRIFTGASLPVGGDSVIIQENVERVGDRLTLGADVGVASGDYVRDEALDFAIGDKLCSAGSIISVRHLALLSGGGCSWLRVRRRPRLLILSSGSELVMAGDYRSSSEVIASNALSLRAMGEMWGCESIILPLALDSRESLESLSSELSHADVVVSSGGASVGDYDLIRPVLSEHGLELDFHKVLMRPGKPMSFGFMRGIPYLGLPGNPISVLACGVVFLRPLLLRLCGVNFGGDDFEVAFLASDLGGEGVRTHYMRGCLRRDGGELWVDAIENQDSSLLTGGVEANCFIVREAGDSGKLRGDIVSVLRFPDGLVQF